MEGGHLFVVLGKIGSLAADASIIPTDRPFSVRSHWHEVIRSGKSQPASHRPARWEERGWGRSAERDDIWFLDVWDPTPESPTSFDRLTALLEDMVRRQLSSNIKGRPVPLVLVPVIGTSGGGKGGYRGEVISQLLGVCAKFVAGNRIDIAIVTPDRSEFSAIQHRRVEQETTFFAEAQLDEARRLGRLATDRSLALFVGAGTSVPAGLPAWDELLQKLSADAKLSKPVIESFKSLSVLDQAELIHAVMGDNLQQAVVKALNAEAQPKPALAHALLAGLEVECAVTTNYDEFYEIASNAGSDERADESPVTAVLPSQVPSGGQRWLLKMHGSLKYPKTIVLTRGQFTDFQGASGPSGAILQSLLLTKHLMVVGTSMTDDNVLRLIYEVISYRRSHMEAPVDSTTPSEQFGSILEVGDNAARRELYSRHFTCVQMPGPTLEKRARQLEIFLDAVGAFAATDASWLLDQRFEFLLTDDGRTWAETLRTIAREIAGDRDRQAHWTGVLNMLSSLGAFPDHSQTSQESPTYRSGASAGSKAATSSLRDGRGRP